ncbi:hypothetical protein PTKIN_Ptkin10aG0025500 [Pterospermum kingtungense]
MNSFLKKRFIFNEAPPNLFNPNLSLDFVPFPSTNLTSKQQPNQTKSFGTFYLVMEMEQSPSPPKQQPPRGARRSKDPQMDVQLPVTNADPSSSSSIWDWGDLLDFAIQDDFSISFDDENLSPSALEAPDPDPELETETDRDPAPRPDRVRKRDPRLTCSNFVAGLVPCACPEIDEQMEKLEEEEAGALGKKRTRTGRIGSGIYRCQVPGCEADISELKGYHRRHRICLRCANSSTVLINGETKRYCQQCGNLYFMVDV